MERSHRLSLKTNEEGPVRESSGRNGSTGWSTCYAFEKLGSNRAPARSLQHH